MTDSITSETHAVPADTRQRLLEAAGQVFAQHGFHQATVRQITDHAGVNLAAVNYHFRDKAELYAATIRECFCATASGGLTLIDRELPPSEQLRAWIDRFVRAKMGQAGPTWHHQLMAREMQDPTPPLGPLVEENICPDARELSAIVRAVHGRPLTEDQVYLLGFSIAGQVLFYLSWAQLLVRIHPPFGVSPPRIEDLIAHIYNFSYAALVHYQNPGPPRKRKK